MATTRLPIALSVLTRASDSLELIAKNFVSMASYHDFRILHLASQVPCVLALIARGMLLKAKGQATDLRGQGRLFIAEFRTGLFLGRFRTETLLAAGVWVRRVCHPCHALRI